MTTPHWPRITAQAWDHGGEVTINGTSRPVTGASLPEVRKAITAAVAATAASLNRPVKVAVTDPDGAWPLIIHPDGTVEEDTPATPDTRRRRRTEELVPATATPEPAGPPAPPLPDADPAAEADMEAAGIEAWANPPAPEPEGVMRREALSRSFLTQTNTPAPAQTGWRGFLTRVGIKVQPSPAELERRADERAVSQHWPGPRTIAIVNGKGGANKTPTTILLSALFARYGGSGVLAWDNNPTRGTLGWRTEQGPHDNTVLDLLPRTDALLAPDARAAELAHYVHHQTQDKYDVLRSHPEVLATDQRITAADFDRLHTVATKYFRLIVIDSGNDESAESWLRMIDHADQLIVATTTREEHAESGRLLLDELTRRDPHSAALAENAVAVISHASTNEPGPEAITEGFSRIARAAIAIPYDPKLSSRPLHYGALAERTQRAWLRAAAAVAKGL